MTIDELPHESLSLSGRERAIALLGEEIVLKLEADIAEADLASDRKKEPVVIEDPVEDTVEESHVFVDEPLIPEPLVDKEINNLIEAERTRDAERRMRLVGKCYHCKGDILEGHIWYEEKIVYDPIGVELKHGIIHKKCLVEAYRNLTVGLVHDIHSREASYQNVVRMLAPKEDG